MNSYSEDTMTNGHAAEEPQDMSAVARLAASIAREQADRVEIIAEVRKEIAAHDAASKHHAKHAEGLRKQFAEHLPEPKRKPSVRKARTTDRAAMNVDARPLRDRIEAHFRHNDGLFSSAQIADAINADAVAVARELKKMRDSGSVKSEGAARGTKYQAVAS